MNKIGYALSSEEHSPADLVKFSVLAEQAGFEYAFISDHFHPWITKQGHSGFVWGILGAIANATTNLKIGTGVTCPIIRIHPAIIAQAAATASLLMPGRFWLGLGSGENLNEHIIGEGWPPIDIRLEMFEESIKIIRQLWEGGNQNYIGNYYKVEDARIFSLPAELPPILIASAGPKSAKIAGKMGDGFINTSADKKPIQTFEQNGGKGKPKYGQISVCYDENDQRAIKTAHKWWPTAALSGQLNQELRLPVYFEQASSNVTAADIAETITCGSDKEKHIDAIEKFFEAGYDYVYIHQIGPNQEKFIKFYTSEILPEFA